MENTKIIKQFTDKNIDPILNDINSALAEIKLKYGLKSISLGRVSYNDNEFGAKLTVKSGGAPSKREESKNLCRLIGLPVESLGKTFTQNFKEFTVDYIDLKKRKYPVICQCNDGKQYKFPVDIVNRMISTQK